MSLLRLIVLFFILVSPPASKLWGAQPSNHFTFRTLYASEDRFSYDNLYLLYRLRLAPVPEVAAGITLVKGCGEGGCYPGGYVHESSSGLYENGSYYVQLKDILGCKQIIAGNYIPHFGQGLLFGGSYPLILYNPYYDLARIRDRVHPSYSASKAVLLEGLAAEIQLGIFTLRPFVSWNKFDCTAGESDYYRFRDNDGDGIPNDEDEDDFTGYLDAFPPGYSCKNPLCSCIRDDADYGIEGDRAKRNNLTEYLAGLNISAIGQTLLMGGTFYYSRFNRLIDPYYNFEEGEGGKTAHLFRGKSYVASSLYFKLYGPLEIFGEAAGTLYRRLSYYPEFNGDYVGSLALTAGLRKKINRTGLILWGGYVPASFVNPHGLELPEGLNNLYSLLLGLHHTRGPTRFIHWVYGYAELYSPEGPATEERGVSYNHRIELPLGSSMLLKMRHNLELIDHHSYAPEELSVKATSKLTLLRDLSRSFDVQVVLENRFGGPVNAAEPLHGGAGLSGELIFKDERHSGSCMLIYYVTDTSRYSYLYPYERPLYDWSFVSRALHGNGIAGMAQYARIFKQRFIIAVKLRYQVDFLGKEGRGVTLMLNSRIPF